MSCSFIGATRVSIKATRSFIRATRPCYKKEIYIEYQGKKLVPKNLSAYDMCPFMGVMRAFNSFIIQS